MPIQVKWDGLLLLADQQEIFRNLVLIGLSLTLILLVLFLLASTYRANNVDLKKQVSTIPIASPGEILLAPRHLAHPSIHAGKAPKVEFWVHLPQSRARRVTVLPLKVRIQKRNSANVHDDTYQGVRQGGQIGIDERTRSEIEAFCADLMRDEGRRVDVDTDMFEVRLKYPSSFNIAYLLREHPDSSVRISAWVFILTSMFSVVQSIIMHNLGF